MISEALLQQAHQYARDHHEPLLTALLQVAGQPVETVLAALAEKTGIAWATPADLHALEVDFQHIPYSTCLQRECLVLQGELGNVLAVSNPLDNALLTWAAYRLPGDFRTVFLHPLELKSWLGRLENQQQALAQLALMEPVTARDRDTEEISLASIAQDESQVVRLVNSTLYDAHQSGASDIHLENTAQGLVIKYRIDGVLSMVRQLPDIALAEQVISRLKVMAELDIGEKRIPQDGRFAVGLRGRDIDFRVSVMPGLFGEDAVLRILDKQHLTQAMQGLSLASLGFTEETQRQIRRLASQPYGMLLVTGPTGSGKTTTLYATLGEVSRGDDKIITIEDPVEYQLPGVLQIPVNEKKGLTFARGLRSILRHDPDRILVGEIRDRETAEIAVQAALTGHLVYTSVHANNVFDVLSRFRHMGVDAYSFVTALNGVVAQRLVRMICGECSSPDTPADALLEESGLAEVDVSGYQFRKGLGCAACRGTGYKGRKAVAEILRMSDMLREALLAGDSVGRLKQIAYAEGTVMMRQAALSLVKQGLTTLPEINRITFAGS